MISFETFIELVAETLQRALGERYMIESTSVRKNNNVSLKAILIRHPDSQINTTPVVYVGPLYEAYKKGSSIDKLTEQILEKISVEQDMSFAFAEAAKSFEAVREHVAFRLVSKERNEELLKDIPWKPFEDLAIIYYLHFGVMEDKQISTIIHNYQMEKWNVSLDELHELARENTPNLCPSTIGRLDHLLFGREGDDDEMHQLESAIPTLYILSNRNGLYGAGCMLYDDVVKDFAEDLESDLIILPSSVHEILILKYDADVNLDGFRNMVRCVNSEDVEAEDVLSDNVYIYSREDDAIRIA